MYPTKSMKSVFYGSRFKFTLPVGQNQTLSMLCLKPSLELVTRKEFTYAFGLYHTTVRRNSTKDFPSLARYLQKAYDEIDLTFQKEDTLTDNIEEVVHIIKNLNNKVSMIVLAEAASKPMPLRSPLDILKAPYYKTPPTCSDNISTTYAAMLTISYVSIFTFSIVSQTFKFGNLKQIVYCILCI